MKTNIPAIVLAAGKSMRMGKPKLLLPLNGKPLIEHSLRTLSNGGANPIVLVVGALYNELAPIGHAYGAQTVRNTDPDGDMASSVLTGLRFIPTGTTGVLILPGDHPQILPQTVNALMLQHGQNPGHILIPQYAEKRGHPTLFPTALLKDLGKDRNLRDIINAHPGSIRTVHVEDPGILHDIDTPEDYAAIIESESGALGTFMRG